MESFRRELDGIHQLLSRLKTSLSPEQENLLRLNRREAFLSDRDIFPKLRQSLPSSLAQSISGLPSLAKQEKELTVNLKEHQASLAKIVEKMLKVFEKERTKVFNFVKELEAELSAYHQKKEEITKTIEELEKVKGSIELMRGEVEAAISKYFSNKKKEAELLYEQLWQSTSYYRANVESTYHLYANPIYHKHTIIDNPSAGRKKHLQKKMMDNCIVSTFSPEKISQLKALLSKCEGVSKLLRKHPFPGMIEHFLGSFGNLTGTIKKRIEEGSSSFDLVHFLRCRWVTHMTIPFYDLGGATPIVFPFFSELFSGKICSAKYLKDNQQKFAARSGQAEKYGDAYTVAFSVGAEMQYGDYGFLFNALELVGNCSFYYHGNTGGSRIFDELHVLDLRFNPDLKSSPGARIDITKGYALIPNARIPCPSSNLPTSGYVPAFTMEDLQRGHVKVEFGRDLNKDVKKWDYPERMSPQVLSFLKERIIFYDAKKFKKIVEKIKKEDSFVGAMFGFFLLRSLKNKLVSPPKKSGRIVIRGMIRGSGDERGESPTYQGDHSGPIFAYIADPELLKRTEQEIEKKSQFNEFVAKANAFLDNFQKDLSVFNE